jgi:hypothetical protein
MHSRLSSPALDIYLTTRKRIKNTVTNKHHATERLRSLRWSLDTESEFHTHVDVAGHLDHLRELHRLLGSALEVLNREDLETRLVELEKSV